MLSTCTSFAAAHCLVFNASKTQLIQFSRSRCSSVNSPISFLFNGHSVKHLGHILTSNLSETEDIDRVRKDFIRKANCMLFSFPSCNPFVKTRLLSSFCLSLYGSALWFSSAPALETTFNNVDLGPPSNLSYWHITLCCPAREHVQHYYQTVSQSCRLSFAVRVPTS